MCHTKNNSLVALNPVSSLSYPPTTVTAYRELRDEFTLRLVRFDKNRIEAQQFFVASDALLRRNVLERGQLARGGIFPHSDVPYRFMLTAS